MAAVSREIDLGLWSGKGWINLDGCQDLGCLIPQHSGSVGASRNSQVLDAQATVSDTDAPSTAISASSSTSTAPPTSAESTLLRDSQAPVPATDAPSTAISASSSASAAPPTSDEITLWMRPICLTALAVYSCYIACRVFIPIFTASFLYGAYCRYQATDDVATLMDRVSYGNISHGNCLGGVVEGLTGVHVHPSIELGIQSLIEVHHLKEHRKILVPVTALRIGIRAGIEFTKAFMKA